MKQKIILKTLISLCIIILITNIRCKKDEAITEPKTTYIPTFIDSISSEAEVKFAGVRSSSYGVNPFPTQSEWKTAMEKMSSYFNDSTPCAIWIIGEIHENNCHLYFPSRGINPPNVTFEDKDYHEKYLNYFDENGIAVFLQVEPGDADINKLIEIIFNRYKHHLCIVGFGVDIEWYKVSERPTWGVPVEDDTASVWEAKLKSYKEEYQLFLKHWDSRWMPATYRGDIAFINDSQGFSDMESMADQFFNWGNSFKPNDVYFQIGYENDKRWWKYLSNPPKLMGDNIAYKIEQQCGIFWVDFTLRDVLLSE